MGLNIDTMQKRFELIAAAEVAKTMAFYSLCIATRTIRGDQREVFSEMRDTLISIFKKSKTNLSKEETVQFHVYAEAAIRDLFDRIRIEGEQLL